MPGVSLERMRSTCCRTGPTRDAELLGDFELRGRDRTVRCWVSPLTTPDGRITGTICIALDESIEVGVRAKRTPGWLQPNRSPACPA